MTHGQAHVSKGGMVQMVNKVFTAYGFINYSKIFWLQCKIRAKHIVQGSVRPLRGHFPTPPYPFHTICLDFELNKCKNKKYCLVIIDMFSKCIEAFPVTHPEGPPVAKFWLKKSSQDGPPPRWFIATMAAILTKLGQWFNIDLKYHCTYHPQSVGLVERHNVFRKKKKKGKL